MSSPDDFAAKIAVNAVTEVFKAGLNGFSKADQWFQMEQTKHDFFGTAARKYAQRIEERYNNMRIFGMNHPVPLRSIYTRVNILEKITATQQRTIQELERFFNRDRRRFGESRETKTCIEAATDIQKCMVLGKPGSGKTTYLKYVALQAIDGKLGKKRVPIFITLKDFADSGSTLMDCIIEQFDICQIPDAQPFIERILEQGRCVILLDGLDTVSAAQSNDCIRQIVNFSDKYSDNQLIVSCRIAAYDYCFEKFTDVEIADFEDNQIQAFVKNWFGKGTKKAQRCWEELTNTPKVRELASNPLLLTMLCLTFDEKMAFPSNRAELYGDAINTLLRKWDTSRGIGRDEIYKNLSVKHKEQMFSRIAAKAFQENEHFIPQRKLEKHVADFIVNLPSAQPETVEPDSEVILKAIEAQHGIFVERAKGIYSFSHLTFQEYFTAKYVVDNAKQGTLEKLAETSNVSRWMEVILITCQMLEKADELLEMLVERLEKLFRLADPGALMDQLRVGLRIFGYSENTNLPEEQPQNQETAKLGAVSEIRMKSEPTRGEQDPQSNERKLHVVIIPTEDDKLTIWSRGSFVSLEDGDIDLFLELFALTQTTLSCLRTDVCLTHSKRQELTDRLRELKLKVP